ncbi:hypothetical protein NEOC65_000018 [Neochlamydia sp. AcF65]|nr:hypothetical protein [Neochlamydia sp. AcF65]
MLFKVCSRGLVSLIFLFLGQLSFRKLQFFFFCNFLIAT